MFAVVKNAVIFFVVNFQHIHDSFLRIIHRSRIDGLIGTCILKVYDTFYQIALQEGCTVYFSSFLPTLLAIVLTLVLVFFKLILFLFL